MSNIKKATLWDRFKEAVRAFKGQPVGSITYGIEVKRCADCAKDTEKDCKHCGYKIHSNNVAALPDCNDCAKQHDCEYLPRIGEYTRMNCPLHEPKKKKKED